MDSIHDIFSEAKETSDLGELLDRQESEVEWLSLTDSITNEVGGLDISRFHVIEETCESSSLDEADGDIETETLTETPEEDISYNKKGRSCLSRYRKPSVSAQFTKRVLKSELTPSTSESNNSDSSIHSSKPGQNKRKAGWPKGRKRKPDIGHIRPPKAPSTGYIFYMIEKRKCYNHLPFHEVTKILGNEWTKLDNGQKKVYLDRAENDKKRYREELKAYRKSDAYQTYMKWKKTKRMVNGTEESDIDATDTKADEDNEELYCRLCDQWFVNRHNKKEHLGGKVHKSNEKLEKVNQSGYEGSGSYSLDESSLDISPPQSVVSSPDANSVATGSLVNDSSNDAASTEADVGAVEVSMYNMMDKFSDREKQINDLKSKMKSVEQTNKLLRNSISGLEHRKTELTESLARLKAEEKRYKPLLLKFWSIISMTISSPPTTDSAP